MANNVGTLVIAPVRPQSDADTFPSALANELQGGLHVVASTAERDAIPSDRLIDGMLCIITADWSTYQLRSGVWEEYQNVTLSDSVAAQNKGNGSAGTAESAARADHEHPLTVKRSIPAGETWAIASDESMLLAGSWDISGNLEVAEGGLVAWL